MKAEYRIPAIVAFFLAGTTVVYAWWTYDASGGHVEWIGTVALLLSALLCAMLAGFFWVVSRRIDPRPEDRPDADVSDGAGEVGFFSPGSYWPFGLALAAAVAALGLAYVQAWLILLGIVGVLIGTAGLLFEYYTGARRGAEH